MPAVTEIDLRDCPTESSGCARLTPISELAHHPHKRLESGCQEIEHCFRSDQTFVPRMFYPIWRRSARVHDLEPTSICF
jgi:hypothetical protein